MLVIEPGRLVRTSGVADKLDLLRKERRAVGLLDEKAESQKVKGGQSGDGARPNCSASRGASGAAFGQGLFHQELGKGGNEAVVASKVFSAIGRRGNEADEPVTGYASWENGGDGARQARASFRCDNDAE